MPSISPLKYPCRISAACALIVIADKSCGVGLGTVAGAVEVGGVDGTALGAREGAGVGVRDGVGVGGGV